MFTFISWDSMGELLSEIGMVLLLCIFLFAWAARLHGQEEARRAALPPPADPSPTRSPDGMVSAVRPLVDVDHSEPASGNDPRS